MTKIIINADDFGYSRAINYGIIDCYNLGIVTSTTLMANLTGFNHAVSLAKDNPGLGVGVHLTLTCGRPITDCPSLTKDDGEFYKQPYFTGNHTISELELYNEWDAQIRKCIDAGIKPTHLDSHHHMHTNIKHREIFVKLAKKYNLPVRSDEHSKDFFINQGLTTTTYFDHSIDTVGYDYSKAEEIGLKAIEEFSNYETVEVMCHPGYLDNHIYDGSSFAVPRIYEMNFLTDSHFSNTLRNSYDFELINFKEL